jgi:hypothetical protein
MLMMTTDRFLYSAPLVPWTDAELDRLNAVWLQVQRAAWRLPSGYPSALFLPPSARWGCPEAHLVLTGASRLMNKQTRWLQQLPSLIQRAL